LELNLKSISKSYDSKVLFQDLNLELRQGDIIGVCGANGAGKSTFIKCLCGVLSPDSGAIDLIIDSKLIDSDKYYQHVSLASPYLNLYKELTLNETLKLCKTLKKIEPNRVYFEELIYAFKLNDYLNSPLINYSSGMLAKTKLIIALLFQPRIICLDEAFSNFDLESVDTAIKLIKEASKERILVIASNDEKELAIANRMLKLPYVKII
jgi:ABC-type multidrug transport system ATPase subunit